MRGKDELTGEFLSPSRSAQRRDALDVLALAKQLMEQSSARLNQLPMGDELRDLVKESQRITAHGARKRQTQFLAKILRKEADAVLEAIRKSLNHSKEDHQRETAEMHRAESWRDRLIEDGDEALAELIAAHPSADRQHLRQLVRQAKEERAKDKPPRAYRELYREIRELFTTELEAAEAEETLEDDDFTHVDVDDFEDLALNDEIDRDEQWERY